MIGLSLHSPNLDYILKVYGLSGFITRMLTIDAENCSQSPHIELQLMLVMQALVV